MFTMYRVGALSSTTRGDLEDMGHKEREMAAILKSNLFRITDSGPLFVLGKKCIQ